MRNLVVAGLLAACLAAPAVAQTHCSVTNTANGFTSTISGDISGTVLSRLMTKNGPVPGTLKIDAGSAYKALKGEGPTLSIYRGGESAPDKDWRQPGTVATEDGGVAVRWPGFTLKGARVANVTAEFAKGYTKVRATAQRPAKYKGTDAFVLPVHWTVQSETEGVMIDLTYDQTNQWRDAFRSSQPLLIDLYDEAAGVHIGTVTFNLPGDAWLQDRVVSDVNALRKAFADKVCK